MGGNAFRQERRTWQGAKVNPRSYPRGRRPPERNARITQLIKPIGAICNLDCTYCYYLHKQQLLGSNSKFRISDEILETHIRQYMEGQDRSEVVFSWHCGEPSLLGFEKAVALEQK